MAMPMRMHSSTISKFTVEKFRNDMLRREHSEGQVNRVLSTYRHMGNRLTRISAGCPFIRDWDTDSPKIIRSPTMTADGR